LEQAMHEQQPIPPEHQAAPEDRSVIERVRMAANGERNSAAAPGLEQQIAALAAQVRNLGVRLANARSAGDPSAPTPVPPSTRPPAAVTSSPAAATPTAGRLTTGASARILEMAEAAAVEIRATAELEAQRIRDAIATESAERLASLLESVGRQCDGVAALTAELDRVESSTATLRAQAVVLNSELQGMLVALSAVLRSAR
jgi:cell division septum initiation protein DivIVA